MVRKQEEVRECIICSSTIELVEIRQIIGMKLDFVEGLTYDRIEAPIVYCNECYMRIWNKNKKG